MFRGLLQQFASDGKAVADVGGRKPSLFHALLSLGGLLSDATIRLAVDIFTSGTRDIAAVAGNVRTNLEFDSEPIAFHGGYIYY